LVREGLEAAEATTEFDGTVVFDGLPAGAYDVELDPEQARRLAMRLTAPVRITVDPNGPAKADPIILVEFSDRMGSRVQ
jgi:hypothetical protein